MVGKLIDGTYKAQYYDLGINEGLVYLTPFEDFKEQLGAEKVARIEQAIQDLKDGKVDLS